MQLQLDGHNIFSLSLFAALDDLLKRSLLAKHHVALVSRLLLLERVHLLLLLLHQLHVHLVLLEQGQGDGVKLDELLVCERGRS